MTSADMTSAEKPPFYLTTAIAYANGPPHLGHAYEAISSDVIARFKRLDGYQVHFLTGMDEHGQKVEKTAADKGVAPQVWCDGIADDFRQMMQALNISIDDFIRTTEPRHREASQALWKQLQARGDIYLGAYKGWYSVRDEAYFAEDELTDGPMEANSPRPGPRWNGSKSPAISSGFPAIKIDCWPIIATIPTLSSPASGAMKSKILSSAGLKTSRSPASALNGAFRSLMMPIISCTSGWMP